MQCVADIKFHGKSPMPCIKKAIADALDDGVDMLTDTKKILRFDEYEQLFPTDKQLDRLYEGCDETAYFETIENCLFAKSRGAIKTDIGYYFVQPKGKVEYKLKTTPGNWSKEWLVENFQSIFEEEQCPCLVLHKTLGVSKSTLEYVGPAKSLTKAKQMVTEFLEQEGNLDEEYYVIDRLYNITVMQNGFKPVKDGSTPNGNVCDEAVCWLFGYRLRCIQRE